MVFREVEIAWRGETYTVTPSNRLLRKIEREVSLMPWMAAARTEYRVSETAFILAEFLKSAGVATSEDQIAEEIMAALFDQDVATYGALVSALIEAIVPPGAIETAKKLQAAPESEAK